MVQSSAFAAILVHSFDKSLSQPGDENNYENKKTDGKNNDKNRQWATGCFFAARSTPPSHLDLTARQMSAGEEKCDFRVNFIMVLLCHGKAKSYRCDFNI